MQFKINDQCLACGDCAVVCPDGAIDDGYAKPVLSASPDLKQGLFRITEDCTGCASCLEVCPAGAIEEL